MTSAQPQPNPTPEDSAAQVNETTNIERGWRILDALESDATVASRMGVSPEAVSEFRSTANEEAARFIADLPGAGIVTISCSDMMVGIETSHEAVPIEACPHPLVAVYQEADEGRYERDGVRYQLLGDIGGVGSLPEAGSIRRLFADLKGIARAA